MDNIITKLVKNSKASKDALSYLQNNIRTTSNPSEIYETVNNIINEDSEYVRKFLKNTSNIVFQKDFKIENKTKYIFREYYENDSTESIYSNITDNPNKESYIMLTIKDYNTDNYNNNFNFITDVYVNGKRIIYKRDWYERPTTAYYNMKTGGKRIFINTDCIRDDNNLSEKDPDIVSVVVRKERIVGDKFYYEFSFKSGNTYPISKTIYKNSLGDFNDNVNNLMVYVNRSNKENRGYLRLSNEAYSFVVDGDKLNININDPSAAIGDSYLIINRCKDLEFVYVNDTDLSIDEYLTNSPLMIKELVNPNYSITSGAKEFNIPLPVRNINEIEVYIDGLRLTPGLDYQAVLDLDEDDVNNNQYIIFTGIIKANSVISIRNKRIYSNTSYKTTEKDYALFKIYNDKLIEGSNKFKYDIDVKGFIDFMNEAFPIDENYIECYVNKLRVKLSDKRSILERIFKIDNQESLNNIVIYSEIDWSDFVINMLDKYQILRNQNNDLCVLNFEDIIKSWSEYYELRPNGDHEDINNPFFGKINRIELQADNTVIKEGQRPIFSVIGWFRLPNSDDEYCVDITDQCNINTDALDVYEPGEYKIIAEYKQGYDLYTDNITIFVEKKKLEEIKIITSTNFFVIGDDILNSIGILAIFEDHSEKFILNDSKNTNLEISLYKGYGTDKNKLMDSGVATEVGSVTIVANYSYNGEYYSDKKFILVSNQSEREITEVKPILSIYNENETLYGKIDIYVRYSNNLIQKIDKSYINYELSNKDLSYKYTGNKENTIDRIPYDEINKCTYNKSGIVVFNIKFNIYSDTKKSNIILKEHAEYIPLYSTDMGITNKAYLNGQTVTIGPNYDFENAVSCELVDPNSGLLLSLNHSIPENTSELSILVSTTAVKIGDVVIIRLYSNNGNVIKEDLLAIFDIDNQLPAIDGSLSGNPYSGYQIKISKVKLLTESDRINKVGIRLLDDDTEITTINADTYGIDKFSETSDDVTFTLKGFNTTNGNNNKLYQYLKDSEDINLTMRIQGINRNIELTNNISVDEVKYLRFSDIKSSIDNTINCNLIFNLSNYITEQVISIYGMRPNTNNMENLGSTKMIKFLINDSDNRLLVSDIRIGLNRFFIQGKTKLYCLDITIDENEDKLYIKSISTDKEFTYDEYITWCNEMTGKEVEDNG